MSSSEEFFPFDSKCARSMNADLTLTFDDKSCLKFSRCLLELSSPVIERAIEESHHDDTLHLPKTSHDMWVLILNYIHPAGKSVSCVETILTSGWEPLADVLRQCDKYEFASLKEDIDERQAKALDERRARAIEALHPVLNGGGAAKQCRYPLVDHEMDVFKAIKEFSLPRSEESVVSYLLNIGDALEECDKKQVAAGYKPEDRDFDITDIRFASIVRDMHEAGRHRFCSLMLTTMIEKAQNEKTLQKKTLLEQSLVGKISHEKTFNKTSLNDSAFNDGALNERTPHEKTPHEKTFNEKTFNDRAFNERTPHEKTFHKQSFIGKAFSSKPINKRRFSVFE